ncbi:MAG: hypothetical protein J6N72_06070 [Psychrobacter sp.]|nr:hypothetical protein [Psychrobacter sp.]
MNTFDKTISIFDDAASNEVEKAFTKDNVIQSVIDGYKNGWTPQFNYQEYPLGDKLESYALLSWHLDDSSYLFNPENTAGLQLNYIHAQFECKIDSTGDEVKVEIIRFKELEVEHEDSVSGLDGEFYVRDSEYLIIKPKDFTEIFERAITTWNKEAVETNRLNPLSKQLKTVSLKVA